MKSIDFTKPGGIPLTQNRFAYVQDAFTEAIKAIVGMGYAGANVGAALSGMVSTAAGGGVTDVSAGWFMYNGELIRFPAQSYPALTGGNDMYVVITPSAAALTYNDGSTPNVIEDVTGVLTELVNTTPTDATHFLLSALTKWGIALTVEARPLTNGDTIDFTRPRTIIYAARGALTSTITMDFTNAIPGTILYMFIPAGVSSVSFLFAGTGMTFLNLDPFLSVSSLNDNAARITYVGSAGATHYVLMEAWEP